MSLQRNACQDGWQGRARAKLNVLIFTLAAALLPLLVPLTLTTLRLPPRQPLDQLSQIARLLGCLDEAVLEELFGGGACERVALKAERDKVPERLGKAGVVECRRRVLGDEEENLRGAQATEGERALHELDATGKNVAVRTFMGCSSA